MRLAIQDALLYCVALQFLSSLWFCNLKNHLIPDEAAGIQPRLACVMVMDQNKVSNAVLKMSEIHFSLGEKESETGGN